MMQNMFLMPSNCPFVSDITASGKQRQSTSDESGKYITMKRKK